MNNNPLKFTFFFYINSKVCIWVTCLNHKIKFFFWILFFINNRYIYNGKKGKKNLSVFLSSSILIMVI